MRLIAILSAISMALAVALGAFGAHAWKEQLVNTRETFHTATLYHFVHGVGGLLVAVVGERASKTKLLQFSGWLFLIGTVFFCGALYTLALGGPKVLGAVAPIGGLAFILGWVLFAASWGESK